MDDSVLPELSAAIVSALADDHVERAEGLAFELASVAEAPSSASITPCTSPGSTRRSAGAPCWCRGSAR